MSEQDEKTISDNRISLIRELRAEQDSNDRDLEEYHNYIASLPEKTFLVTWSEIKKCSIKVKARSSEEAIAIFEEQDLFDDLYVESDKPIIDSLSIEAEEWK